MSERIAPNVWLYALAIAQAGTLLVFLNFAGALPLIQADWQLSNAEAGAIQSAGQIGYVLAVLVLSSSTDYLRAERLVPASALWAAISNLAVPLLAHNVTSMLILRALTGMGMAGIYMPGLKIISQRVPAARRGRAIGFFVASFTLGAAASVALSGWLSAMLGWRMAFLLTSIGPLVGALAVWRGLPVMDSTSPDQIDDTPARPFSELIHNRAALLTVGIYVAHAWEVFGLRGWLPAFLTAAMLRTGADLAQATSNGASMAGLATLVAAIATVVVAGMSDRMGRIRIMITIMIANLVLMLVLGFTLTLSWALVVMASLLTASLTNADSAIISTTLTETVPASYLGRMLAVYSFMGFAIGGIAPLAFGAVLDYVGATSSFQWEWAFATLALGSLASLIMTFALRRQMQAPRLDKAVVKIAR